MRVHKLNNVEQAMDLLEKHKVYPTSTSTFFKEYLIIQKGLVRK